MAPHSNEQQDDSEAPLLNGKKNPRKTGLAAVDFSTLTWNKKDKLLIAVTLFTTFGDAVEIYLPGIFTQVVSRELKISDRQEGFLAIAMFISMSIASLFIGPSLKRFNRRRLILFSLYTTILATILSAAVPNYWVLLLSRSVRGFSIGLNFSIISVFFATEISSYSLYNVCSFSSVVLFAVGAGWSAILGYLLLGSLGWRVLVVCASVPVFIPPIVILHFFLKTSSEERSANSNEEEVIEVRNFKCRVFKGSVANFINFLQGWGSILLAPAILRYQNHIHHKEDTAVSGTQLLILALLFGGVKLIGRVGGYFLLRYIPFRVIQPAISLVIAVSYLFVLLFESDVLVTVIAIGVANMAFCVTRIELTLMESDKYFFGTSNLASAASVMMACGSLGGCMGAVFAAFLTSHNAVIITLTLSCVQVLLFLCFNER